MCAGESMQARKRILIVEDSEDTRFVYSAILNLDGYDIIEAADGEAGIASAIEHRPDLIITDINMPGLNGFEVARRIRADERIAQTPIVAVTGTVLHGPEHGAAKSLFDRLFFKPMKPSEVLVEVRKLLENRE
jgi:two-component system, cell cycle response regulator DivK